MSSFKHIEYLLKRKCFPDYLNALNFKVDLKEISECVGMLHIIKNAVRYKSIPTAFDIGCGKRPTLGVLMALEIKSINNIVSIDPQIDITLAKDINGLYLHKKTLAEYCDEKKRYITFSNALICCNHSHVKKEELYKLFNKCDDWTYITNPCCINNKLKRGLYFCDRHIRSPKNEIYVFEKSENS